MDKYSPLKHYAFGLKEENSFGGGGTIAAGQLVAVRSGTQFKPDIAQITDDVLTGTWSGTPTIDGIRSGTGKLSVRAKGGGTSDPTPEFNKAMDAAFGKTGVLNSEGTTHASNPCTTTSLVLSGGDGSKYAVDQAVAVLIGSKYEVAWITAKDTDTLTVEPAFTSAPGTGVAVKKSITWSPTDGTVVTSEAVGSGNGVLDTFDLDHKDVDPASLVAYDNGVEVSATLSVGTGTGGVDQVVYGSPPSSTLTADYEYANFGRSYVGEEFYGSGKSVKYTGIKCQGLTVTADVGNPVYLDFDWITRDFTVGSDANPTYGGTVGTPTVGLNGKCVVGTTVYALQNFSLSIKNNMEAIPDLNHSGNEDIRIVSREVTGTFKLKYKSNDFLTAFSAGTTPKIFVQCGSTLGNILAIKVKKAKYTGSNIGAEALRTLEMPFSADKTSGADEVFCAFL